MRPALAAKAGSRGKIQVRCCQGRMASSWSHRHTVVSLMVATMPERWASRTRSPMLRRESGKPRVAGSSHARALIWTTTSGGKKPGAARARSLLQAVQAFVEEPFAPQTDHVASHRQRGRDGVVGPPVGGQQDHLGPEDGKIWQRILPGASLQRLRFLPRQLEVVWALPRHPVPSSADETVAEKRARGKDFTLPYLCGRVLSRPDRRGHGLRLGERRQRCEHGPLGEARAV